MKKLSDERHREIMREGRDALEDDNSPDANPYPDGSEENDAWIAGWTDAFDASRDAESMQSDYESEE